MPSSERKIISQTFPDNGVRTALIVVENQPFSTDTRVKSEAAALLEDGWRVHVICPNVAQEPGLVGPVYADQEVDGVQVHSYRMDFATGGPLGYLREYCVSLVHIARLAWRVLRKSGFSVIHLCNPPDTLFLVGGFYKVLGKKVIFDHHDLFPEMNLSRYKGQIRWVFYGLSRFLEFLTFRTADAVLSTNQSYREIAKRRGRVPEGRIFVVRNGPRAGEIAPMAPDPGLKKGFPFLACYAGIMGPEDGILELMEVVRHVVTRLGRKDLLFCFLGDGAARPAALERVRAWGIEPYVDMPGMIHDRPVFCRYLSTADVMLSPEISNPHNDKSTFIKIAEYMAMGKPIVAYDLPETRYTAGSSAVFVRSGDFEAYAAAVVSLLDDADRRAAMGRIGMERVAEQFQWERQKPHLLTAYHHVLGTSGASLMNAGR